MAEQYGVDGWAWNKLPKIHRRARRHFYRNGRAACDPRLMDPGLHEVSDVADPGDCETCRRRRNAELFPTAALRAAEAERFNLIRLRLLSAGKSQLLGWVILYGEDVRWLLERLGEAPQEEPG
jgi:hypothetical protein